MVSSATPSSPETGLVPSWLNSASFDVHTRMEQKRLGPTNSSSGLSGNAFDGARNDNLYGHAWMTSKLSADSTLEVGMTQEELRARSRDMYRNSDVGGAIETRVDLVVGTGFTLQSRIRETKGFCTKQEARDYNEQLEEIVEDWSHTADVDGKTSLWEITRLVERHNAFDGESLVVWSDVSRIDGDIPLALEVIDPDRLRTPPDKSADPFCRLGVQKDKKGRILGYWVQNQHPGDQKILDQTFTFYDADRVIHIFEKWFAGQSRGLPWLTRALTRIVDGGDLHEAGIIKAQIEACYAAFIKKAPTNPNTPEDIANAGAAQIVNGKRQKSVTPATIAYLEQGEDISFGSPPHGDNTALNLQELNHRRIAGALNTAYEMLARDWRGISFAGGRLVLSGVKLDTRSRQKRLRDAFLRLIYRRIVFESILTGACDIPEGLYLKRPRVFEKHRWVAQAWPFCISPKEEMDTGIAAVQNNMQSQSDFIAETFGTDSEDVFEDRREERATEREYDIVPPQVAQYEQAAAAADPSPQKAEAQKQKVAA